MSALPHYDGLLVLPHVRVQNANAISSPLTHGFPAMTAFLGLMWALARRLERHDFPVTLDSVGVICHDFQEQTTEGSYVKTFCLTRNPIDKDGSTAAIVEEGRMHMEITLVFGVSGGFVREDQETHAAIANTILEELSGMRIAGGSVLPVETGVPTLNSSCSVGMRRICGATSVISAVAGYPALPWSAGISCCAIGWPICVKTPTATALMPFSTLHASTGNRYGPSPQRMSRRQRRSELSGNPNPGTAGSSRFRLVTALCPELFFQVTYKTPAMARPRSALWKACIPSASGSALID